MGMESGAQGCGGADGSLTGEEMMDQGSPWNMHED